MRSVFFLLCTPLARESGRIARWARNEAEPLLTMSHCILCDFPPSQLRAANLALKHEMASSKASS